ncbi:MAG TPA: response regulator [Candidatus Angelobacter sp.]
MELRKATVLLVEDEPFLREVMGAWLRRSAGRVIHAENGADALRAVTANKIDLIISDVRMPVMDGIDMLKRINQRAVRKPGVILITGFSDLSLRQALDMGAEAVLEKPIRREELLHTMQRSLAEADELWRKRPAAAPSMKLNASFSSLAAALEKKRIAFGRRGFCITSAGGLHEGPVKFAVDFKADRRLLSGDGLVRWIAPEEGQAGIEITHVDDASRAWVVDLVRQSRPLPFIPGSTGAADVSGLRAA